MPVKKRSRAWLIASPLLAYWLTLFAASILIATAHASAVLVPFMLIAGLPFFAVAVRALVRSPHVVDLAHTDDLTGIANRRAFVRDLERALNGAAQGTVGLVLLDVDALKQTNDGCGHQAGDELLRGAARHLSALDATVYRLGGDEFALLVDRRYGGHLCSVLRRIQPYTAAFANCGHDHAVHISYGFSSNQAGDGFDDLVRRADQRLAERKRRLYAPQASGAEAAVSEPGTAGPGRHLRIVN